MTWGAYGRCAARDVHLFIYLFVIVKYIDENYFLFDYIDIVLFKFHSISEFGIIY